jgi:peptide deformylase
MKLKIVTYGDPILRKKCEPIAEITDEIRELVQAMIQMMDESNGCGLAAPQVGYPIRLFVLRDYIVQDNGEWTQAEPKVFINPKLSDPSNEMIRDNEGCLSIPGIRLEVDRPLCITVEATDLNGVVFTETIEGYNARIRMHENDHINGVLFIDRVDVHARKKIEPQLRELKKSKH